MKNKKLSKLIYKSCVKAYGDIYGPNKGILTETKSNNDYLYSDSDDDSKLKIRNLILRLLKHRDELEYSISDYGISLYSSYEKKATRSNKVNTNSTFHIEIIKDTGFNLSCNDRRILMKDTTLYDEMKPQVKQIFDELNRENFKELYTVVMKDNGLNRESNLDDLLRDF